MSIKTIEEKLEEASAKIDAIYDKLNADMLTHRRYESEILAQAARIRFLQNTNYSRDSFMETIRHAVETYFGERNPNDT